MSLRKYHWAFVMGLTFCMTVNGGAAWASRSPAHEEMALPYNLDVGQTHEEVGNEVGNVATGSQQQSLRRRFALNAEILFLKAHRADLKLARMHRAALENGSSLEDCSGSKDNFENVSGITCGQFAGAVLAFSFSGILVVGGAHLLSSVQQVLTSGTAATGAAVGGALVVAPILLGILHHYGMLRDESVSSLDKKIATIDVKIQELQERKKQRAQ